MWFYDSLLQRFEICNFILNCWKYFKCVILWFIVAKILSSILMEGFYEDPHGDKIVGLKYWNWINSLVQMRLNNSDIHLDIQVSSIILLPIHSEHIRIADVEFLFTASETFSLYGDERPVAGQRELPRVSFCLRAAMQTQIMPSLF